jgi:YgiT-type zinc finger domain-containing protein
MECPHCKGTLTRKVVTHAVSRKGYHLLVDVPAWVCDQCGEPLFDEATMDTIQEAVCEVDARLARLVDLPAAA